MVSQKGLPAGIDPGFHDMERITAIVVVYRWHIKREKK
jgi:hypothetical protein